MMKMVVATISWMLLCLHGVAAQEYTSMLAQVGVTPELHADRTGAGVKVGQLDGYPNMAHCDLSGSVGTVVLYSGATRLPDRWSTDHVTHTVSILNGRANGCGVVGVAPGAYTYVYPFWSSTDTSLLTSAYQESWSYNHAISLGAKVFNRERHSSVTINGVVYEEAIFAAGVIAEIAKKKNQLLFTQAAGNQGKAILNQYYSGDPSNFSHLIIVGGVNESNVLTYSNWPAERCFYKTSSLPCPEAGKLKYRFMVAPVHVEAADMGGGTSTWWGTSLAAPFVAGAAAILFEEGSVHGVSLSPTEVADHILLSATDLGDPGVDGTYGNGLLNVPAALARLRATRGWTGP